MKIWRLINFEPNAISESEWGKFHTRDAYIVLFVSDKAEHLTLNIHHWIGKESSPVRRRAVAISLSLSLSLSHAHRV